MEPMGRLDRGFKMKQVEASSFPLLDPQLGVSENRGP